MSKRRPSNVPASVQARLMTHAREHKEDYNHVLTRYALERLLYRLSISLHRETFILKGAMLFRAWTDQVHRPTKDIDLLGHGDPSPERLQSVFQEICGHLVGEEADDGLIFAQQSVEARRIKEDQDYEGVRVEGVALLGNARIPFQVDIGFGDAVTPDPLRIEYPTILDFPKPQLCVYPRETVVAEKYQAMVMLGISNSRMKDFYDVWILSRQFGFDGLQLAKAILATFRRRKTPLPEVPPLALTAEFHGDASKKLQWQAFLKRNALTVGSPSLDEVANALLNFLWPPTVALVSDTPFAQSWPFEGPWV